MRSDAYARFAALLVAGISLLAPHGAYALAITSGTLNISNVQMTAGTGTIQIGLWGASAEAGADNSLGESDGQIDAQLGVAQADGAVTWADGHGSADAVNLTAHGASSVNLPGFNNQADAAGRGFLLTTFTVVGGTGDVVVTFSMNLSGSQEGIADSAGSFSNDLAAVLEVGFDTVLFYDNILGGGPDFPDTTSTIATRLSDTRTLAFDTQYLLFIHADSESDAMNAPEPTTLLLMLAGIGILARRRNATRCVAR